MGNIFVPKSSFSKNQQVGISGFSFSNEHVPKEIKRYGNKAVVVQSTKMMQSRSAPTVYVTRVYYPQTKHYEVMLTNDLR